MIKGIMIGFLVIVMERLWARTCEFFLDLNFQHIKKNSCFIFWLWKELGIEQIFVIYVEMEKITGKIMLKMLGFLVIEVNKLVL